MEPEIERPAQIDKRTRWSVRSYLRFDRRSLASAAFAGVVYGLLAWSSIGLTRGDPMLAAIWLPNAFAVAFLLRVRLAHEMPFWIAIGLASLIGHGMEAVGPGEAVILTVADLVAVSVIVRMARHGCAGQPDMRDIGDLARFAWAGGLVGPLISTALASLTLLPADEHFWKDVSARLLAGSMVMALIVPAAVLIHDALRDPRPVLLIEIAERGVLLLLGLAVAFAVLRQDDLPLLFLIPPITLLHAFRLGSLGTAIFVGLLAIMTVTMTRLGYGPLTMAGGPEILHQHLIQAFVAANFLTGLPVAAVLAGRERMMAVIAQDKRQLGLLTDTITDAILRFDRLGICTYASPSARVVLAVEPAQLLGSRLPERMHPDERYRVITALDRLWSGHCTTQRLTCRRLNDGDDGAAVFVEADCALAHDPDTGEPEGIIVSLRDVTQRVGLERALTSARRRAENAARAKSEFLANMSHEIRTPMNGVLGFAELMLNSELDSDQRRHVQMIVESGRSMMLLLNDILDLSKIEAGQIGIAPGPVDLRGLIKDCAALHRPAAERKGLDLRVEFGPPAGEMAGTSSSDRWIVTDGLRLRQILLNLIANAVKFTREGHVTILCSIGPREVLIQVLDTGIGIATDRLEAIFEPFTQGDGDTARLQGGTGLGLSISRRLANLLGGSISVESEPGTGSRFTLCLPAVFVEPDDPRASNPSASEAPCIDDDGDRNPEQGLRKAHILLAEDHDINRLLASEMLERCGQQVVIAHDGNEAIALVIDAMMRNQSFDLILMDVQMPGCDGYAATRAIRDAGIGPDILPVIALTANAFPEDIAAAREAGMQGHLAKPLVLADLARALQRWLPTRIVEREIPAADHGIERAHRRHSPEVIAHWYQRRAKTIEAVRNRLERGDWHASNADDGERAALVQQLHKLAGTAALFGEAELGTQAAVLERAIRKQLAAEELERLALEFVTLADKHGNEPQPLEESGL